MPYLLKKTFFIKGKLAISLFIGIFFSCVIFTSCYRQDDEMINARKVYSYDNRLSSISSDGSNGYWVGTENGDVNFVRAGERKTYHTSLGRIYDIVRDNEDTTCLWIGSRNAGVQQWREDGDSLVYVRTLNMSGKGSKYSPYDLLKVGNRIFAGTSQGIFVVPTDKDSTKSLIPMYAKKIPVVPNPVSHLAPFDNKYIFATSGNSLVRYDIIRHQCDIIPQKEKPNFVNVYGDKLYILTDNSLIIENVNGKKVKAYSLDFKAVSFYKYENIGIFLTPKYVYMTYDYSHFKKIALWGGINPSAYNLIIPNDGRGFVVVLSGSNEIHLPHHFNLQSNSNGQQLMASSSESLFYVDEAGYVYRGGINSFKARALCKLPDNGRPIKMAALGNDLYYVTTGNNFYRIHLYGVSFFNQILAHPKLLFKIKTHATAIYALPNRDKILLGIQDELLEYDTKSGRVDTVEFMHGKYITQFYSPRSSDDIYISTLNDGIFVYNDGAIHKIPGTEKLPLIQGIAMYGSYDPRLYILTNHFLMRYNGDRISTNGDLQLCFANDSIICTLPQQGIHFYGYRNGGFIDKGTEYADISFLPSASMSVEKNVYLGSDLGMAVITPGVNTKLHWVEFSKTLVNAWYVLLAFIVLLLVASQVVVIRRNRHKGDKKQLKLQMDDLNHRMRGLKLMRGYLTDNQTSWLDLISKQLSEVDVNTKRWRNAYDTLARLSDEVSRLNRDAALQIVKALEMQMKEILRTDTYDGDRLINASIKVHESGVVDDITNQFVENKQWLDRVEAVNTKIRHYETELSGALRIKGVDDVIVDSLKSWKKTMLEQPLDAVEEQLDEIEKLYNQIYSDNSLQLIYEYMDTREQYLAKRKTYEYIANILSEKLKALHEKASEMDRAQLLRELNPIEMRIQEISTLHHLRKCMRAFVEDEDAGKENVANIEKYINRFFALFKQTDSEVVDGIFHFHTADNQQVKVLVLLIADKKVKRTLLPAMLGLYGNLNPVVSRLYHGKIGENLEKLSNYYKNHTSSMAYYILQLVKA